MAKLCKKKWRKASIVQLFLQYTPPNLENWVFMSWRIQKYPIYHCFTLLLHYFPSFRALFYLGNTALHYAKPYPDQSVAQFLLNHGAKIDINHQKNININPRTLEQYFYDYCIIPEGDDIDDEDFKISIKFKLFEKPVYGGSGFWFIYLMYHFLVIRLLTYLY